MITQCVATSFVGHLILRWFIFQFFKARKKRALKCLVRSNNAWDLGHRANAPPYNYIQTLYNIWQKMCIYLYIDAHPSVTSFKSYWRSHPFTPHFQVPPLATTPSARMAAMSDRRWFFCLKKNAKSRSLKCHRSRRLWIVTVLHLWPDKEISATRSQCFTFDHCLDIPDFGDFGAQVFRDNFTDPPGNISHPKAVGKMSFLSHFETHLPRSLRLCPWKVTEFPIGKLSWIIFQPLFFSDELLNFGGMFSDQF